MGACFSNQKDKQRAGPRTANTAPPKTAAATVASQNPSSIGPQSTPGGASVEPQNARNSQLPTGTDMTQFESSGRAAGSRETMSIQPPPAPRPSRRSTHKPKPQTVVGGYNPLEVPGPPPVPPVPSARSRQGSVPTQPDEAPKTHRSSSPSTGPDQESPLNIDELQGLASASGVLSEKFKAWDRTGQLTERTKPIYSGGFSDVSKAKLGDRVVAVKTLRLTNIRTGEEDQIGKRLAREIYVWIALDHPNVLRFLGFTIEDEKSCLISPWCDNGTLHEYLSRFPNTNRRQLVREVAEGLRYLHAQKPPIIHGDLKTTNVFVTVDHVAKISDFGSSRRLGQRGTGLTTSGLIPSTIRYNAPEILRDGEDPTLFSDVYSFAYVALETMTGKGPFWRMPNDGGIVNKVVHKRQMPSPEDHPGMEDVTWEVLRKCWNYKPSDRPNMVNVCKMLSEAGYGSPLASVRPHRRGLPIRPHVSTGPDVLNPSV